MSQFSQFLHLPHFQKYSLSFPKKLSDVTLEYLDFLKFHLNGDAPKMRDVVFILHKLMDEYKAVDPEKRGSVPNFPKMILQVDMIHALLQTMITEDSELFVHLINFFQSLYDTGDVFHGRRMLVLLEHGLRVATVAMVHDGFVMAKARKFYMTVLQGLQEIPWCTQLQILAAYGKVPEEFGPKAISEWTEMLLLCNEKQALDKLRDLFRRDARLFLLHPKDPYAAKMVLTLCQVFINCEMLHRDCRTITPLFARALGVYSESRKDNAGETGSYLILLRSCLQRLQPHDVFDSISHPEFLKYLGDRISSTNLQGNLSYAGFEEICNSYEVVVLYMMVYRSLVSITSRNGNANMKGRKVQIRGKLMWSLATAIPCLEHYALSNLVLKFVTELICRDLKSELVTLKEEDDENQLGNVLANIYFHALGLTHKAVDEKSQIVVWNFLDNLLSFSSLSPCGRRLLNKYNLEWSPWILLTFVVFLPPQDQALSSGPTEFWALILNWLKLLTKQKGKYKYFLLPSIDYSSFTLGGFVFNLRQRIQGEKESRQVHQASSSSTSSLPRLLQEIGVLCDKIEHKSSQEEDITGWEEWEGEISDALSDLALGTGADNIHCHNNNNNHVTEMQIDAEAEGTGGNTNGNGSPIIIEEITIPDSDSSQTASESEL